MLMKHLNGNVSVKLKNDVEYKGRMVQCDNFMNVILDGAAEYNSDVLIADYGYVFIRGNNILYIVLNN